MKGTPLYESYAAVAPDVKNFPVLIEQVTAMMMHDFDRSAEIKGLKAPTLLIFADWDAVRTSHAAASSNCWEVDCRTRCGTALA
jgi:hypothetical protein